MGLSLSSSNLHEKNDDNGIGPGGTYSARRFSIPASIIVDEKVRSPEITESTFSEKDVDSQATNGHANGRVTFSVDQEKEKPEDKVFTVSNTEQNDKLEKGGDESKNDEGVEFDLDDLVVHHDSCCSRWVEKVENAVHGFFRRNCNLLITILKVIVLALYIAYFGYSVYYRYYDEGSYILTVITAILVISIVNNRLSCHRLHDVISKCLSWYGTSEAAFWLRKFLRIGICLATVIGLCVYLGISVFANSPQNGQAVIGIFALIIFCFIFSYKPSRINWHTVIWGFIVQFGFATLTLRTQIGHDVFMWLGNLVYGFVRLSDKGSQFVLGASFLAPSAGFFFDSAGVIVFFNSIMFMLEYVGALEFIVLKIGGFLALCLETGPVESVVAGANIFIGLSEAPLLVRPFLPIVTKSELHAIMSCGFASISGAFMAMFIKAGAPASHLLTAAVISAPAALAISKLMYPEMEKVNYKSQKNIRMKDETVQKNCLQAFSDGAGFSIKLVASIMVNMIAFVSLLNLVNTVLVWMGDRMGVPGMTFDWLCSYLLYPLSYIMGTHPDDCGKVAGLIGIKMMATPFVAYRHLGQMIKNREVLDDYITAGNGTWHWSGEDVILDATNTTLFGGFLRERSEVITTYAMCGISAFPAIGFSMGTLIPMCPERKPDVVKLVIRAFIAGNLANIVTGAVAGVMFTE